MSGLPDDAKTSRKRLLRLLFFWHDTMPAYSGTATLQRERGSEHDRTLQRMINPESCQSKDWVSDPRSYVIAWGLPGIMLLVGIFLDPLTRTVMWAGALVWKGIACLANAARWGRTHCYFTGPYFLVLAIVTVLHGLQIVWLGASGWLWLSLMIVAGGGALWFFTERAWGKFFRVPRMFPESTTVEKCID